MYENSDGDVMEVDAETGSEILFMSAEVMVSVESACQTMDEWVYDGLE